MELEQISDGPIRVGTIVRRRHTRAGAPVEGTMECAEFEPDRAIGWLIHDGPVEMRGRQSIEPHGRDGSTLTITVDIPGMVNPMDPLPVAESLRRIKELIAAER